MAATTGRRAPQRSRRGQTSSRDSSHVPFPDARGAMPEPDSREPWFVCEAHAKDDIVDRVLTSFEDSLAAALEARAHGGAAPTPHGGMASAAGAPDRLADGA